MIITKLTGGLGNQMFQYAIGRALAYRNRCELKLDISSFHDNPFRSYRLKYFNIIEAFATDSDLEYMFPNKSKTKKWLAYKIKQYVYPHYFRPIIYERWHTHDLEIISRLGDRWLSFDPEIFKVRDNSYLIGTWQSEKYFNDIAGIIKTDFTLKKEFKNKSNRDILNQITSSDSISVHFRRGDYISNPKTNQFHGALPLSYYYHALNIINQKVKNPILYIFSDDIDWIENNIRFKCPAIYMKQNKVGEDYNDLFLMSNCKHHILANSSFSWWGAWLSSFKNKIVIAPSRWFAKYPVNINDRFPKGWIII